MKRVAFSFIGKDRPGIIAEVSRVLFEAGCNIEDTTMTILEGEFAMILIASLPSSQVRKKLEKAFKQGRQRWGLHSFWKTLPGETPPREKHPFGSKTYLVTVMGKDRTGIVYETSRILAQAGLNITDLNSKILGDGKKSIFAMILEVDIPPGFPLRRLEPAWQRLRKRFQMDVTVKPVERLSL